MIPLRISEGIIDLNRPGGLIPYYSEKYYKRDKQSGDKMAKKSVSYSQMAQYNECPYRWYLNYVKGLSTYEANIHLIFGSAMHTVLQHYLTVMYGSTVKAADELDLPALLKIELSKEFLESKQQSGIEPATKEELMEFYQDGLAIIEFFKKHRADYFNRKGYSLVGIEVPLQKTLVSDVNFNGFIDVVIKDDISGKIKIIDFKTSTKGWRDYTKNDVNKTAQIVLYKKFYSELYAVPIDKIDVEFLILKRKLYENSDFPQKRLQKFSPASGTVSVNKTMQLFDKFVSECYTPTGEFYEDKTYPKTSDSKKCQWCNQLNVNCPGVK